MAVQSQQLDTNIKALTLNLDETIYGTFAEIGAGQEVARWFFRVGGAAGTVAKTMSAYDMKFSDEIYGKSSRYVSYDRLLAMFDHEFELLIERLNDDRGESTRFFVFADTVSARNFKGTNECHGWMGVRFQGAPGEEPSDVFIHVNMTDDTNLLQQEALGIVGVNIIYAAFFEEENLDQFINSLLDGLTIDRIEIDRIEFRGPRFEHMNNRLASMKLVRSQLTNAVMFDPDGSVLQPSSALYKRPILIERGSFRPINCAHLDMIKGAEEQFQAETAHSKRESLSILEMTLNNLLERDALSDEELLGRVDMLLALGFQVLVSNYSEYYHLTTYLRRYTNEPVAFVMGVNSLLQIFDKKYYSELEGGILEAFGKLFSHDVKLYVYPMKVDTYMSYLEGAGIDTKEIELPEEPLVTADNVDMPSSVRYLYSHLFSGGYIVPISSFDESCVVMHASDLLDRIECNDCSWEEMVPEESAAVIKEKKLFGFNDK